MSRFGARAVPHEYSPWPQIVSFLARETKSIFWKQALAWRLPRLRGLPWIMSRALALWLIFA